MTASRHIVTVTTVYAYEAGYEGAKREAAAIIEQLTRERDEAREAAITEREACAEIAETMVGGLSTKAEHRTAQATAAAIRSRQERRPKH